MFRSEDLDREQWSRGPEPRGFLPDLEESLDGGPGNGLPGDELELSYSGYTEVPLRPS